MKYQSYNQLSKVASLRGDIAFHFSPFAINLHRVWLKLASMPKQSRNFANRAIYPRNQGRLYIMPPIETLRAYAACEKNRITRRVYDEKYAKGTGKNDNRRSCGVGQRWHILLFHRAEVEVRDHGSQTNGLLHRCEHFG